MDKVPGLKQHGMSLFTVRRPSQSPIRENIASQKYKALIDARIGVKKNNYREYYHDSHYLFTRNEQKREFCTFLGSDACIFRTDDIAKIRVGAPAVSRYHQVRRLFAFTNMPNLSDHDFPLPNYLVSVSGCMYLEQMNDESHESHLSIYDISQAIEVRSNKLKIDTLSDNLWNVLIRQCETQLNLTVTKVELREIIVNMGSFNKAKILFHGDNFKKVLEWLSSLFHCEVIKVDPDGNREVFNGQYDSTVKQSSIYYGFSDTNAMSYHVSFCKESKERYKTIPGIDGKELKYDALGRFHIDTPYLGHCHLRIRSHKYKSTTAATHIIDLYDILTRHKPTKSVYMFHADGSPDFNPSHIANNFFLILFV